MEDIKSLIIGILGGLIVLLLSIMCRKIKIYSLKLDVKNLDAEISNIELISQSNTAFLIFSFRAVFIILTLLGVSYFFTVSVEFIRSDRELIDWLAFVFSTIPASMALYFVEKYKHLNNAELAVQKMKLRKTDIEQKISKL